MSKDNLRGPKRFLLGAILSRKNDKLHSTCHSPHPYPCYGSCSRGFFWLFAAWVKSRAERPSVSGVNRQLHVQIGCKLGIRNRKDELTHLISTGFAPTYPCFFLALCCLGQVPDGAPFSQRSEQATACTNRMQIRN